MTLGYMFPLNNIGFFSFINAAIFSKIGIVFCDFVSTSSVVEEKIEF